MAQCCRNVVSSSSFLSRISLYTRQALYSSLNITCVYNLLIRSSRKEEGEGQWTFSIPFLLIFFLDNVGPLLGIRERRQRQRQRNQIDRTKKKKKVVWVGYSRPSIHFPVTNVMDQVIITSFLPLFIWNRREPDDRTLSNLLWLLGN